MSYWRKKQAGFEKIQKLLDESPGQSARQLARALEVAPSTITRQLPSMEEAGYLLSEDDGGRLWPFKREK